MKFLLNIEAMKKENCRLFIQNFTCFALLFWGCTTANGQIIYQDTAWNSGKRQVIEVQKDATHFIVIGDWGRNGADHQQQVADQMGIIAAQFNNRYIISTGDNFYPQGVISEQDPLFFYSFENIYKDFTLQVDWYLILGNHDYMADPDAQVRYSKISRRWKMPARYYEKQFGIPGTKKKILIAFIDTNPLIPEFYSNELYGPNVKTQDTTKQKNWIEDVLSNKKDPLAWKIVVGHHPMFTAGGRTDNYDTKAIRNTLKPVLDKHEVDAYISGHEHSLQYLKPSGKTHHFISGAGSERTPVKPIPEAKFAASQYGFMVFSIKENNCLIQVIDFKGEVIYKSTITK